MSNIAEIRALRADVDEIYKRIDKLTTSALTIIIPAATTQLADGERYAGTILKDDGTVDYHVILMASEIEATWLDAVDWAAGLDGHLPTRREQSLLYSNLKCEFQSAWYWSSEQHADYTGCAWMQSFSVGYQYYDRMSSHGRARAVRRLFI